MTEEQELYWIKGAKFALERWNGTKDPNVLIECLERRISQLVAPSEAIERCKSCCAGNYDDDDKFLNENGKCNDCQPFYSAEYPLGYGLELYDISRDKELTLK